MAGTNDPFQKFKSSINRGVTTINVKTSSSLERAKLKTHIDSLNSEIDRLIADAGARAYVAWQSEEPDYSVLDELFETVQQKKEEVAQLQQKIEDIEERTNEILGTASSKESASSTPSSNVSGITCPSCGASCKTEAKFCKKCGYKLQQ